jgi:hypothetical protein
LFAGGATPPRPPAANAGLRFDDAPLAVTNRSVDANAAVWSWPYQVIFTSGAGAGADGAAGAGAAASAFGGSAAEACANVLEGSATSRAAVANDLRVYKGDFSVV